MGYQWDTQFCNAPDPQVSNCLEIPNQLLKIQSFTQISKTVIEYIGIISCCCVKVVIDLLVCRGSDISDLPGVKFYVCVVSL